MFEVVFRLMPSNFRANRQWMKVEVVKNLDSGEHCPHADMKVPVCCPLGFIEAHSSYTPRF